MSTKPRTEAASAAPSESAAAGGEKVTIEWEPQTRGLKRGYQFKKGHAATWRHDGTDTLPRATVDRAFWDAEGGAIRAAAGGKFTEVKEG